MGNKKAMISQPMRGLSDEEILKTRNRIAEKLEKLGYEVIDTFFSDEYRDKDQLEALGIKNIPVAFLAKSLESMATVDCVCFAAGWEENRGCRIEHSVAKEYGIEMQFE